MYQCNKKCCYIEFGATPSYSTHFHRNSRYKAGAFIYDPETNRVLLVQSHGQLWGPPKGTLEVDSSNRYETNCQCAIREVKEETGLDIRSDNFICATRIKNRAVYYYIERKWSEVHPQGGEFNDANGITWIKLECLEECIKTGQIVLSQHCKILFKRFLNQTFGLPEFVKVVRKRKKFSFR